ncbi:MAG TPA: nucleotidyl transferase AbiEii/AbiGii toxin family protein [Bdellovibrionota bacterium]|nr:nucleotidyl transferase AbiEii/AbiGii toxin family protein [Bdellovibrionota bacterium]
MGESLEASEKSRSDLAERILPPPLYKALKHIFLQKLSGCALVGGTALAGFYAGHRRSDDLDLFTADETSQKATHAAVQSLQGIGTVFEREFHAAQFYKATCLLDQKRFTVDIVLDQNLFRVGRFHSLNDGLVVADLHTLLMMKSSTLVSRCSEKDLFDLLWLFEHMDGLTYERLIQVGHEIDGGLTGETLLMSVSNTILREEACDFSLDPQVTPKNVHAQLISFQKSFLKGLSLYLKNQPAPPLKDLLKQVKRLI